MATSGDRLNFAGSVGYLDAKYREFLANIAFDPVTGQPLARPVQFDVADFAASRTLPNGRLAVRSIMTCRSPTGD